MVTPRSATRWGLAIATGVFFIILCISVVKHRAAPRIIRDQDFQNALSWRNSASYTNARDHFNLISKKAKERGDLDDEEVRFVIGNIQNTQYWSLRERALAIVPKATSDRTKMALEPYVIKSLRDDVPAVRVTAVQILPSIGGSALTNLPVMLNDTNARVADAAKKVLLKLSKQ